MRKGELILFTLFQTEVREATARALLRLHLGPTTILHACPMFDFVTRGVRGLISQPGGVQIEQNTNILRYC